jgi:hypothetical protein
VDHCAVAKLDAPHPKYTKPIELRLFDGSISTSRPLTDFVELKVKVHPCYPPVKVKASITSLCGSDFVLGWRWMINNGIEFDVPGAVVTMNEPQEEEAGWTQVVKKHGKQTLRASIGKHKRETTFPNNISLPTTLRWPVEPSPHSTEQDETRQEETIWASVDMETEKNPEWIDGVGMVVMDQDDPQTQDEFVNETKELLETLPESYHDFLDIFRQEQGTKTLPPQRKYVMKIDLQPMAKLPVSKLYSLAEHHRRVLLETLDRETKAGRIRQSNAAYGSPMFFVPKKDGRWRMVVDYRRLNENTIPDVYPLPLISQITNELSKAKFFTKLDLVGAYQLLRMAESHEHLTAFRTQYGMYESLVVRDGLRNTPGAIIHRDGRVL